MAQLVASRSYEKASSTLAHNLVGLIARPFVYLLFFRHRNSRSPPSEVAEFYFESPVEGRVLKELPQPRP